MKPSLLSLAILAAASSVSSGASIAVSNLVNTNFVSFGTLTPLDTTYTAKIGFLAQGTVLDGSSNFASINAAWTNGGNIAFATGDAAGYAGYFAGQVNFNDSLGLAGKDVYIWVTNGSNYNIVLRSTTTDFLADASIPNANAVGLSNENRLTEFQLLLGTHVANAANVAGGGSFTVVPEPSSLLLGALGVVGLLRRRR